MTMSGSNRHEILVIVLRSSVCKAPTVLPQRCVSRAYSGRRLIAFSEVRTIHRTGSNPHTGSGNECPLWVKSRHSTTADQCPLYPQKRTFVSAVVMSALCVVSQLLLQINLSKVSLGNLAMFTVILPASSFVSNFATADHQRRTVIRLAGETLRSWLF